jgi:CheY-like chemotaxis protein
MAHILVVDDETHIRFLICKALESAGHSVFEAASRLDAFKLLETPTRSFDMIVLDSRMPHMDGSEFLAILRRRSSYIPVVIVTAHTDTIPQALEHQISGHLIKPFTKQKLIDMVNKVLVVQRS